MGHAGPAARILVVDDDPVARKLLTYILMEAGYSAAAAANVAAASRILEREQAHLLILDVRMPQASGLDFCRQLREARSSIPVLMLSGAQQIDDKVAGFDAGADDYLTKPYDPRELLCRVRALLSRQFWGISTGASARLCAGGLELDLAELSVKLPGGAVVALTPTETRVLQCLMVNAGRVLTRDAILTEAWGYGYEADSNQVEVYIRRIRRKVEPDPDHPCIETIRGLGYRLLTVKQATREPPTALTAAG
jgi:DNA-binding response OmpR family regulator